MTYFLLRPKDFLEPEQNQLLVSIAYPLRIILTIQFIISMLLIALSDRSLPSYWSFFSTLQLMNHLPLLTLNLPSNLQAFFSKLIPFAQLNFFGDGGFLVKVFRVDQRHTLTFDTFLSSFGYSG